MLSSQNKIAAHEETSTAERVVGAVLALLDEKA
jgi:hypothetical protein